VRHSWLFAQLPSNYCANHKEWLAPISNRFWQEGVRRLERLIFFAREKPHERPALVGDVIPDCAAEHWIIDFQRIEDGTLRNRPIDLELHFAL
jgi:hypothetical protein